MRLTIAAVVLALLALAGCGLPERNGALSYGRPTPTATPVGGTVVCSDLTNTCAITPTFPQP